ncbi:MAG TPA: beta/gamma crystallin domain-containing protein [Caldimonas sp.]|nr:beta/gamma crystallin domain-containing protein [Caldimonas sp.]
MLVPTTFTVDNVTKNGCWVKLYDQKNYQGDSFTLAGPIDLAQMTGPFGFNWENKVKSLKTGPKTSLTIYDNRNFKDQDKTIAYSTNVADMSKQLGYLDDFRSMKMTCS